MPATPVTDFGADFAALYKLGLPDITGAKYVRLELTQGYVGELDIGGRGQRSQKIKLGNAWLLEEKPDHRGRFVVEGSRIVEVQEQKAFQQAQVERYSKMAAGEETMAAAMQKAVLAEAQVPPRECVGSWTPVDPKQDATTLIEIVQLASADRQPDLQGKEPLETIEKRVLAERAGQRLALLFLQAAHFYRAGYTAEANRLAAALQAYPQTGRPVALKTSDLLGANQYTDAYEQFRRAGDWAVFAASLKQLLARFGPDWLLAPAVRKIENLVAARVAAPEPPPLAGEGITPEDQALVTAVATAKGQRLATCYAPNSPWLLPDATMWAGELPQGMKPPEPGALDRLLAKGMAAVPVLAAMLSSEYLIPTQGRTLGLPNYDMNLIAIDGMLKNRAAGDDSARVEMMLQYIPHPTRLGEVARLCLQPVLVLAKGAEAVERDRAFARADNSELAKTVLAWYAANKTKTPEALALEFVQVSNSGAYANSAMVFLAMRAKPGSPEIAVLENKLLAALDRESLDPYAIPRYLKLRGDKATVFREQLVAKIEQQLLSTAAIPATSADARIPPAKASALSADIRTRQLKDLLAQLKPAGDDGVSLEKLLAEMVANPGAAPYGRGPGEDIRRAIAHRPAAETQALLLKTAVAAPTPAARAVVIVLLPKTILRPLDVDTAMAAPLPMDFKTHADLWHTLLADERPLSGAGEGSDLAAAYDYSGGGYQTTVGDIAATTIDAMVRAGQGLNLDMGDVMRQTLSRMLLGQRRMSALDRQRALARLDGKPVPDWPMAATVPAERRTAIVKTVIEAKDLSAALAALSDAEMLAVAEEVGKNAALRTKLQALTSVIGVIDLPVESKPAWEARMAPFTHAAFTRATLEKLRDVCAAEASAGRPLVISLIQSGLQPLTLRLETKARPTQVVAQVESRLPATRALVLGAFTGGRGGANALCIWRADSAADVMQDVDVMKVGVVPDRLGPCSAADFWTAIEKRAGQEFEPSGPYAGLVMFAAHPASTVTDSTKSSDASSTKPN